MWAFDSEIVYTLYPSYVKATCHPAMLTLLGYTEGILDQDLLPVYCMQYHSLSQVYATYHHSYYIFIMQFPEIEFQGNYIIHTVLN